MHPTRTPATSAALTSTGRPLALLRRQLHGVRAGPRARHRGPGLQGLFPGSLFAVGVSGTGPLLVSAYGGIHEAEIEGELIVDTGHLVALEDTLDYEITKAGGSWLRSMMGGEGLVLRVSGRGRLLVQSHDPGTYGRRLGRLLPPKSN